MINKTIYLTSQLLVIILVFSLIIALLYALQRAMSSLNYTPSKQKKGLIVAAAIVIIWLILLSIFAHLEVFQDFQSIPPPIFAAFIIPILFSSYLMVSKPFFQLLQQIPIQWLTYIQAFRIPMEIILWLGLIGGFIPFQMTFEGLNFDIIVGITAILGGYVFFGHQRYLRFEAIIWNISGITLVLNVLIIAVLSAPSPFRVFMNDPANEFVAYFPFIWVPGFIVPFAIAIHCFSIKKLLLEKPPQKRTFLSGKKKYLKEK